jgi:hypothetical protein
VNLGIDRYGSNSLAEETLATLNSTPSESEYAVDDTLRATFRDIMALSKKFKFKQTN